MSIDANKEIVRAYLARIVSGGELELAEELLAPELVFTSPYTPEPIHGVEEFKQMIGGLHAGFSDFRLDEHETIGEGSLVASRWTASGTQDGEFAGRPPTGRRFEIGGMSFYRVVEGRIVEGWVNDDTLAMASQLGMLPAPVA